MPKYKPMPHHVNELEFERELTESVVDNSFLPIDESFCPADKNALILQMQSYHSNLKEQKQKNIYVYCLTGRNLKFLKDLYKQEGNFITKIQTLFPEFKYSQSYIYFWLNYTIQLLNFIN